MTTMDPVTRLRDVRRSKGIRTLMRSKTPSRSPLASPPMVASPIDESANTFENSVDQLLTLPRHTSEPLVSFLLRSIFKFPLVFGAIQGSVASLCRDHELNEFKAAYGDDEAEALVYVAFLYAMGQEIRRQHSLEAPDRLPSDTTFREAIGISHLAELFDLDSLRQVAREALKNIFTHPIRHSEYVWAFGKGSRITGALSYKPDIPVKIELVDRFTHIWDNDDEEEPAEGTAFLRLGQDNIEFYLLVKSFCLGHVNEDGVNDISPTFLSKWMATIRKGHLALHKS